MIITIANAKGGVAKTTSAIYLAAAALKRWEQPVRVLDADPQGSASLWADMLQAGGQDLTGLTVAPANAVTLQQAKRASQQGLDQRLVLVDAPPQGRLLETALDVADFVIVPTSDSPLDYQQAVLTLQAVPEGTPAALLVVRAEPHTVSCKQMLAQMEQDNMPRFDTIVAKRQALKNALGQPPTRLYEYVSVLDELAHTLNP